jgi:hypothetical protein
MNTPRRNHPKRRLSIESIESRLMLSGDGLQSLDTDTFNLDGFTSDYAIISDDAYSIPRGTNAIANTDNAPTADFDNALTQPPTIIRANSSQYSLATNGSLTSNLNLFIAYDQTSNSFDLSRIVNLREQLAVGGFTSAAAKIGVQPGAGLALQFFGSGDSDILRAGLGDAIEGSFLVDVIHISPEGEPGKIAIQVPDVPALVGQIEIVRTRIEDAGITVPVESLLPSGGAPVLVAAPTVPIDTTIPVGQSGAQINVGRIIDQLLSSGGDYIDHTMSDDLQSAGDGGSQLSDTSETPQTGNLFDAPTAPETAQVAGAGEVIDEGGMIPIQGIVGQLAGEAIMTPSVQEVIAADVPTEISAELARVAVMELIEGEADPAAPDSAADHTYLVAANDTGFVPVSLKLGDLEESQAALAAVRIVVDQAALAASMAAPANPLHLAALATAVGDAFATAATSAPLSASAILQDGGDARSVAFSEWDEAPQRDSREEESNYSYGILPLVGVLAAERVVAAKRKRKQNAAAAPPLPPR